MSRHAIAHRVRTGRLHPVRRGVFAVGRRDLTRRGIWMSVLLSCPAGAILGHESAAALMAIEDRESTITLTIPHGLRCRFSDIRVHCRSLPAEDRGTFDGIPATSPARTLLDLAATAGRTRLERAVNQADVLDLIDPGTLRAYAERRSGVPGAPALRALLAPQAFRLTRSGLERAFLPLCQRAGLPLPQTGVVVNGFEVDFYWPELGLVIETDGGRYHRTQAQQTRDRVRDQAHAASGLRPLRFTDWQIAKESDRVIGVLRAVAADLRAGES